jgi:hypothetical protein
MLNRIDDLLVCAKNFEELLQALEKLFERLEKFNIMVNLLNTDFCALIISKDGIRYDSYFVPGLLDLPEPNTTA